jgi:hypothetical protein
MTSLKKITGREIALEEVQEQLVRSFGRVFEAEHLGEYELH